MKTYTFEITQTFLEEAEGETFEEALEAALDKAFSGMYISRTITDFKLVPTTSDSRGE